MRLRALDRQLPLAAITAFVWVGAISFFCIFATILCLVAAWSSPAKADPVMAGQCLLDRATYDRAMAASRHPLVIELPPDLSRRFIWAWNAGGRGFGVPPTTNNVTIYDFPRAPFYRIAFFKNDCLVESLDVPEGTFWQVVGAADDTKWRI